MLRKISYFIGFWIIFSLCSETFKIFVAGQTNSLCCDNFNHCLDCSNSTVCCMNQPNTWDKTQTKPFCCSDAQLCCGVGLCCGPDQICCSGWKEQGTCCSKSSRCLSDGTCAAPSIFSDFPDLIWAIPLLICCCCLWCRIRVAAALRRRNNANRQQVLIFNRLFDTLPSPNIQSVEVVSGLDSSVLNSFSIIKFSEEKFPLESDHW